MKTKDIVRKVALQKLKALSKQKNRYYSTRVNQHLEKLLDSLTKKESSILFYIPLALEANIYPTLNLFRKKCKVYVPFMENVSFKMVAYRLPLKVGKFGIKQPRVTKANIKNIEIIVVPVIAVDKVFKRVGFGKGMYDRFYEKLNNKPKVIFVQPFPILEKTEVTQQHDIAGDYLVTYRGILKKEVRDGNRNYRSKRSKCCNSLVSNKKVSSR